MAASLYHQCHHALVFPQPSSKFSCPKSELFNRYSNSHFRYTFIPKTHFLKRQFRVSFALTESDSPKSLNPDPQTLLQDLADGLDLPYDYFAKLPNGRRLDLNDAAFDLSNGPVLDECGHELGETLLNLARAWELADTSTSATLAKKLPVLESSLTGSAKSAFGKRLLSAGRRFQAMGQYGQGELARIAKAMISAGMLLSATAVPGGNVEGPKTETRTLKFGDLQVEVTPEKATIGAAIAVVFGILSWEISQGIQAIPENSLQYASDNALLLAKMADRDTQRQRRRRGEARLSDVGSHSPKDVGRERTYGYPVRAPPYEADSTSFMPTPQLHPRLSFPFFDRNQVPAHNQDAGLQASHAGETSREGRVNLAFQSTFDRLMSYDPNLVVSLLGLMQQSPSLLEPHVQPTLQPHVQPTRGRIVPSTEHEIAVREKILIEPEGNTFNPHQGVPKRIGKIIKGKYPGAWPSWGKIPIQQRDFWFAEFKKYYYWLPHHSLQVRRNFEVRAAQQLRNFFAYARKSGKVPDFVSPDNWAQLQRYWEGLEFQQLSFQNKKNRTSDPEGIGLSLHTCGAIPVTEWRRRKADTLQREPTVTELYKDTHMHRKKDKQGNWVCKKSKLRLEEHTKRWQEYRSSLPSADGNSQSPPLSERDIWVRGNLTRWGPVYGFGTEGVLMKRQFRQSVLTRSSSVNNYDAREMAMRCNESVSKAVEQACQQELQEFRKQVKKGGRANVIVELNFN